MTPLLYRLGHFCARHPVWVLAIWLVVAIVVVARSVGQETNDDLSLPGTDSQAASDLLGDKFPDQANGAVPIVFRAPAGAKVSDTKYKKLIEQVTKAYGKDPAVTLAVGPFSEQGADQLNKKHSIGYISLNLKDSPSELSIEEALAAAGIPLVTTLGYTAAIVVVVAAAATTLLPAILGLIGLSINRLRLPGRTFRSPRAWTR